ncbi:MAG: 4-hydroxy-tetrahydrodipicolinate reductase [Bacteroidales bacterium]|nr:4-hydroxy-tetrahydrodipicolinate reductase [Bacteroidales bacterium]
MKIALIGYGKMGKEIESIALKRGHEISKIIDIKNNEEFGSEELMHSDVAIEFTMPESAFENILKCFNNNLPVVSGTTGWLNELKKVEKECMKNNQSFFYAPNFSIGVNIFFKLSQFLTKWMNKIGDYNVTLEEIHHIHKKDAPSGTAVALANDIIENYPEKSSWVLDPDDVVQADEIPIISQRKDMTPGTHEVAWESDVDSIEIIHTAKNRKGFALGAVLAAEYIVDKKGVFNMDDLLDS